MTEALDWPAHLAQAARSDKPRVSVRTWALRSQLVAAERAETQVQHLLSDLRRHEMLLADREETIAAQAMRIAELKDACGRLQGEIAIAKSDAAFSARALAETTAPSIGATLMELGMLAALCLTAGFTLHLAFFGHH